GFEWRTAGCSMCVGVNGDLVAAGQRCASTSNRNFVGRQGQGARTHLVSPAMAAAAAVTGRFTDVRHLLANYELWIMQAFKNLDAVAVPMARPNVDTDQIVPARYLRKPRKLGFGDYLFRDLRLDKEERERDFVLNKSPYRDAKILVAERNFGCGSS